MHFTKRLSLLSLGLVFNAFLLGSNPSYAGDPFFPPVPDNIPEDWTLMCKPLKDDFGRIIGSIDQFGRIWIYPNRDTIAGGTAATTAVTGSGAAGVAMRFACKCIPPIGVGIMLGEAALLDDPNEHPRGYMPGRDGRNGGGLPMMGNKPDPKKPINWNACIGDTIQVHDSLTVLTP